MNKPDLEVPVAFPELIKKNGNILTERSQMQNPDNAKS
jgi:hypothetical protein